MASDMDDSHVVVALIENRAREVGLTALDLRSATLHLNQYIESSKSYQNTLTLLQYFKPSEIIVPARMADLAEGIGGAMALASHSAFAAARKVGILANWPMLVFLARYNHWRFQQVTLARGCFDDVKGALLVQSYTIGKANGTNVDRHYKEYYLCLGAASALLKWVESEKSAAVMHKSLQVTFNGSLNHLSIDATSIQNLEVIEPLPGNSERDGKRKASLFGVLNSTKTVGGARLLKANLLQPLKDKETIKLRLDCLEEIINDESLYSALSNILQQLPKDLAIHSLGKSYREQYSLPNLRLPFNNRRGFYITVPVKDVKGKKLPPVFLQLNIRNKEASAECFLREERCLEGLCQRIGEELTVFSSLLESIFLLDMITNSFAYIVTTNPVDSYVRPEFTDFGPLAIDGGRHPIAEGLLQDAFVANNTFVSEASNAMIITGPNMSGKSTYLRQVALLTVMAHIGCYVPARFASFRVVDRIFTRIGTGESIEENSSTFLTEMRETAFLMDHLTPRSLVVVDELGCATSTLDGLAIAWSCCEHLLTFPSYIIFATHMKQLGELASIYPNCKVCYFSVGVSNERLAYKYVLKEGYTDVPHYGLRLAEVMGFPAAVMSEAQRIADILEKQESRRLEIGYSKFTALRRDYVVAQRLLCLQQSNLSDSELKDYLLKLKASYLDGTLV
ncbi:unnamed protein product [Closterium sp. NIES-54]